MVREVNWASDLVINNAERARFEVNDSQFAARNLVRTIDSTLQGIPSFMKRYIRDADSRGDLTLQGAEVEALESTEGTIDDFVQTVNIWSRKVGFGQEVQCSGDSYRNFARLLSRRDRLNHPRKASNLVFGGGFLRTVIGAMRWFGDATEAMQIAQG